MGKYNYKKVKGFKDKKFIENGHTMFEEDVLERLKRLEYLEDLVLNSSNNLKELKKTYLRKIKTANKMIDDPKTNDRERNRIKTKLNAYKCFVVELKKLQ
jgi:hypothetical protein